MTLSDVKQHRNRIDPICENCVIGHNLSDCVKRRLLYICKCFCTWVQVTEDEIVVVNVPSYHQQFSAVIKTIPPRVQVSIRAPNPTYHLYNCSF
jgi:hypothetical protein